MAKTPAKKKAKKKPTKKRGPGRPARENPKVGTTVYLDPALKKRLRIKAVTDDTTISEIVEAALRKYGV